MNASVAIQVLPKVATKGCPKVCVDAGAPGAMTYVKINYEPTGVLTMEEKCAKHRED